MEESKRYTLNKEDLAKVGKGLLIALGGALATYLLEIVPSIELGMWTPIVVGLNSVLVNIIRKFLIGLK